MILSDAFYEDEVREGFFVPAAVKQAWGAELIVLSEIHKICRQHNIMYFAEWGTFLGAIRHGGFIPWDDDLDIGMKRADFKRFMEIAPKELPEGFEIYHFRTHENHTRFLSNVVGKARICFEKEHLEKYHGFPYITGIDIFILDYVYRDEQKEKERVSKAKLIITVADKLFDGTLQGNEAEKNLAMIEQMCSAEIPKGLTKNWLRSFLYGLAEDLFAMVPEEDADYMTRMMPNGLDENNQFLLPKELLNDTVDIPFEETKIPVLSAYDLMLRKRYGEYMTLYKNASGHNYPYFEAQKENFQKLLDFDLPGLPKVDRQQLRRSSHTGEQNEYKTTVLRYLERMEELLNDVVYAVSGKNVTGVSYQQNNMETDDSAQSNSTVSLLQQCAIKLGTFMEECKGEGYDLVKVLEEICDDAYQIFCIQNTDGQQSEANENLSCAKAEAADSNSEKVEAAEETAKKHLAGDIELLSRLKAAIAEKLCFLKEEVLSRRTVVFLPFKPDYWSTMEQVWKFYAQQEKTEVFVVPIPYYYKNYDFTLREEQYNLPDYPQQLQVKDYRQFSLAKVHPDVLITQCPYDSYNETISVSPEYYTLKLRQMTDLLLYVPWFQTGEFTRQNEREYHNMNGYCTMPGVMYADKVLTGSKAMRSLYIERLTEFAGEDTRSIWEEKISCIDERKIMEEFLPMKSAEMCSKEKECSFSETREDSKNSFPGNRDVSECITKAVMAKASEVSENIGKADLTERAEASERNGKTVLPETSVRKKVIYGISTSAFMELGENYLNKIRSVLQIFEEHAKQIEVTVIFDKWQKEHLQQTRPKLYSDCENLLRQEMPDCSIVEFDSPKEDIPYIVDCFDAYYGAAGTVAHFFRNAGKPVMIENPQILN